jgi:hypothetical protein
MNRIDYSGQRSGRVEPNESVDNDAGRYDGVGLRTPSTTRSADVCPTQMCEACRPLCLRK